MFSTTVPKTTQVPLSSSLAARSMLYTTGKNELINHGYCEGKIGIWSYKQHKICHVPDLITTFDELQDKCLAKIIRYSSTESSFSLVPVIRLRSEHGKKIIDEFYLPDDVLYKKRGKISRNFSHTEYYIRINNVIECLQQSYRYIQEEIKLGSKKDAKNIATKNGIHKAVIAWLIAMLDRCIGFDGDKENDIIIFDALTNFFEVYVNKFFGVESRIYTIEQDTFSELRTIQKLLVPNKAAPDLLEISFNICIENMDVKSQHKLKHCTELMYNDHFPRLFCEKYPATFDLLCKHLAELYRNPLPNLDNDDLLIIRLDALDEALNAIVTLQSDSYTSNSANNQEVYDTFEILKYGIEYVKMRLQKIVDMKKAMLLFSGKQQNPESVFSTIPHQMVSSIACTLFSVPRKSSQLISTDDSKYSGEVQMRNDISKAHTSFF